MPVRIEIGALSCNYYVVTRIKAQHLSSCLNDPVDLPDKVGSFLSGVATSMVVKNGTKKNFSPKNTKNYKNSYKSHEINKS